MNNHKFPDDFLEIKPFIIEGRPGISLVPEKGNQVSCMLRMKLAGGIKMTVDLGEIVLTTTPIVNMHGVKTGGILCLDIGKAKYLRLHQNPAIGCPVKLYKARKLRCLRTSPHPGHGLGFGV